MRSMKILRRFSSDVAGMTMGDTKYLISRRTGKILSQIDEHTKREAPAPVYSLADSLQILEEAYMKGELHASKAVKSGLLRMREECERYEELLYEDDLAPHLKFTN